MIPAESSRQAQSARDRFAASIDAGHPTIPLCEECGERFFYPRARCPVCFSNRIAMAMPVEPWRVRSFCWVMRPQSPAFEEYVPILLMVGGSAGVYLIAEGRGWTLSNPPHVGSAVQLASGPGVLGDQVAVFEPQEGDVA